MFNSIRAVAALMCALALVLSPVVGLSPASAQEVSAGNGWALNATTSASEAESQVYVQGSGNFVVTTFTSGSPDIATALSFHAIPGTLTDIDVADTYALHGIDHDGVPFGMFSVVTGNQVHTLIAPVSLFAGTVASAQAGIQVDGAPVLPGVDGNALAGVIAGVMGGGDAALDTGVSPLLGSSDSVSDAPNDVTAEAATEETEAAESTAEAAEVEPAAEDTVPAPTGGETGFIDGNTWVSPGFGTVITWGDAWEPQITDNDPGFTSWTTRPNDTVCLYFQDEALAEVYGRAPSLCVRITEPGSSDTLESWQARFASPDQMGPNGHSYLKAEVSETGYTVADTTVDGSHASIQQGFLQNGFMYIVALTGPTDALPDLLASAQADVTVDGQPALFSVDPVEFQAEYDAKIATLPDLAAQREAELQALGLVEPNHYQSLATGCDVSWQDPWRLSGALHPVDTEGINAGFEVPPLPGETFTLINRPLGNSVSISCVTSLDSLETLPDFVPHTNRKMVEGTNIHYAIVGLEGSTTRDGVALYSIRMVVKPVGSPTVTISLNFLTREEFVEFQAEVESGTLVIGGVDVFQEMKNDDIASQIP